MSSDNNIRDLQPDESFSSSPKPGIGFGDVFSDPGDLLNPTPSGGAGRGGALPDLRSIPRTNLGRTSKGEYKANLEDANRRAGTLQDFKRQQNLSPEPKVDTRSPYFEKTPTRDYLQRGRVDLDRFSIKFDPKAQGKIDAYRRQRQENLGRSVDNELFRRGIFPDRSKGSLGGNPKPASTPSARPQFGPPAPRPTFPNDPPSRNTPSRPSDRSGQLPSPTAYPGKSENQPLGDRPPTGRSIPFTTRPPEGAPIAEMFGIPFGNAYNIHGYFRGPFGEIDGTYPAYLNGTYGGDASISVEFAYEYQPNFFNPDLKYWVWDCYTRGYDGNRYAKALSGQITTLKNNRPFYGITEIRCVDCNPPINPIPAIPTGQVEPYQNVPPLKSPQKERPPNFKPIPNGFPDPEGFPAPAPFPQPLPQPFPSPTEQPQQQPKPDADKEPQRNPSARRNPKPTPRPAVKPIADPTATGSGSFPKPDTSGTPQGSGSPAGGDYAPTTGATPPSPSPTPNYPDPARPQSQPFPSATPAPSGAPLPDFDPIKDKTPTPIKEPDPVVQFPPFPVAPKLNSGNACKTADPCTQSISSGVDSANKTASDTSKKVKDIADVVDKIAQIADLSLLVVINDKLGPKLPGGLSKWIERIDKITQSISSTVGAIQEKLGKFAKWARLGQLVSVLTLITTLHNALMLSRNLGETLLSMLSNGLAVFGIKDDNNNAYDLGELIGKTVESMMKETIGTENYTTLSTNFKKANRIYQAAANLGNSIQSLRFSVVSALETIGGWNARIGNALKRSGVVNESSYAWMNPTPNFDNKFTRALETVEDTVSQIDSVASEILSAQETVTQIASQKDELANSLGLGTEKPQTENQPQKTAAIASKTASVSPNIEATDLNKPGV